MSLQDHGEKILRELGLTFSQTRVYIALVRLGDYSTVKAVSNFSSVARQDLYRIIAQLQELSLVETEIGNLAQFRAIPMQEAVSILMERRSQKTRALLTEATELLEKLPEKEAQIQHENSQFVLIPKREVVLHRLEKAIERVQEDICSISPWREFAQWMSRLPELWSQTLKRGVTVRWITGKPENTNSGTENLQAILKNPNLKLRIAPEPPERTFGIYDGEEVYVATRREPNAAESPALWTNNPTITYLLKDYFEMKWKLTTEYKP